MLAHRCAYCKHTIFLSVCAADPSHPVGVQTHRDLLGVLSQEAAVNSRHLLLCCQVCCASSRTSGRVHHRPAEAIVRKGTEAHLPALRHQCGEHVVHSSKYTIACSCRCITALVQLQDGALNDEELNRFQIKCFHAPLQPTELAGVKEVVGERLPGVSTSISHASGMT